MQLKKVHVKQHYRTPWLATVRTSSYVDIRSLLPVLLLHASVTFCHDKSHLLWMADLSEQASVYKKLAKPIEELS